MKNQKGMFYFLACRSLFLTLLILAGPVFSSSFFEEWEPDASFAAAQPVPADEYAGVEPSEDEGFVDCDSECDDQDVGVNPFPDEGFIDGEIPEDSSESYDDLSEGLSEQPSYQYPYDHLPSQLEAEGKESIKLFVYGSLMDFKSAKQTLSESTLETRRLAKAYGVKTIYNRSVPYVFTPHWGEPENPYAIAMLNTIVSGHSAEIALGVLLDIPLDEIPALLSREVGYDLKPVVVEDWVEPSKGKMINITAVQGRGNFRVAYILSSPTPSQYTAARLLPREGYYQRVMEAARSNGDLFFQQWLNNTYLADGVTTVGYYELYKDKVAKEFDQQRCAVCVNL